MGWPGWVGELVRDPGGVPYPTVFHGETRPGVRRRSPGPCPSCLGRVLAAWEYCLDCDRWGLDGLVAMGRIERRRKYRGASRGGAETRREKKRKGRKGKGTK